VILVLEEVRADLGGSQLRCPDCSGLLRRWGFARPRSLRCSGGGLVWLRPRRVRCASCRVTHVLLPALAPPHRDYAIDVVGYALLASACGQSHRTIGADLRVEATVQRHPGDPDVAKQPTQFRKAVPYRDARGSG
jgi:Domain of unknown function (DUF6431)